MDTNPILSRFLRQTSFVSEEDYRENLEFLIPNNFNFAYDVVDAWAEVAPDKIALLWTNEEGAERRLSFADLKRESDQAASYLQTLGIGRGDMVMLIEKRRLEWWLTMLALHKLGAVPIPATHMLTSHDIVYRNNAASVKAIICVGEPYVLGEVKKALPDSPTVDLLVSIGPNVPEGFHDWHKEIAQAPAFSRPRFVNANGDTMILYFTSGTSGEPKMVAHDFLYALGHLTTGVFWHNLTPDSIHLTVADTGWGKAVWGKFYGQWFAGACVFVFDHEEFTAEKILRQMEKYRITSFCAPPTVYRLTTLTLGTFPWMQPKPGSMGKPNAQYEIALLRPDLTPCEDGEKGEIAVRLNEGHKAIGLFKEYYRDSNTTFEACHDGYYFTGDMAWRDKDGYYWFEGRADDVIKSSGYRIGPFEVESALMKHPAVVECAITGVPDETRGMVVKATVVLAADWKDKAGDALVQELQAHVKHETAPYKYPRIIEFVDELPKTISGKIRRVEIRERDKKIES